MTAIAILFAAAYIGAALGYFPSPLMGGLLGGLAFAAFCFAGYELETKAKR